VQHFRHIDASPPLVLSRRTFAASRREIQGRLRSALLHAVLHPSLDSVFLPAPPERRGSNSIVWSGSLVSGGACAASSWSNGGHTKSGGPRCSRDAACHSVTSHVLQVPAVAYNPRRDPIAAIIRAAYCYRAVRRASNSRPVRCHTIQDALVSRGCKSETYVSRCEISKFSVKMPCVRTATRSCTATLRRNLSRAIRHRKTTRGTTCGTQHGTKRGTTDAGDALAPSEIRVKSDGRLVSRHPSGG
jgi:hypothetical protein